MLPFIFCQVVTFYIPSHMFILWNGIDFLITLPGYADLYDR